MTVRRRRRSGKAVRDTGPGAPAPPSRLTVLTRSEFVLMWTGFLCLGFGYGVTGYVYPLFGLLLYLAGLALVGVHCARSFQRGIRVGIETECNARDAILWTDKRAFLQRQLDAARQGRN